MSPELFFLIGGGGEGGNRKFVFLFYFLCSGRRRKAPQLNETMLFITKNRGVMLKFPCKVIFSPFYISPGHVLVCTLAIVELIFYKNVDAVMRY